MSTLILKKDHKTHRFVMETGYITVGSSRKAQIRLPKTSALPIEGMFEITEKGWTYHSFSMTAKTLIQPILKLTTIQIGEVELKAEVVKEQSRFSSVDEIPLEKTNLDRQIILAYFRGNIALSTTELPNMKATIEVLGQKIEIQTTPSAKWIETQHGDFTIRQKTVAATDTNSFAVPLKSYLPTQGKDQWVGGSVGLTLVLALSAWFFGPSPQQLVAENEAPKVTAPVLVKVTPPRQVKQVESAKLVDPTPGKAGTSLDRIKNLTASISSKAGAFIAKTNRLPTSIGPNGNVQAAAIGVARFGGSSTDWNKMAGSKVAGQVGGSLSGGTGGGHIAAGGTGASGVGLLEQEGEVSTGLDRELIAALIRKNIGHILYCYERSLSANPNLFGKVSVRFIIGASGGVETQKIGESTLRDNRVEGCILDKVSQWKFPEPKGGVQVVVTYPFLFKTTN